MEYTEVRKIIDQMEKDGWTINNANVQFLKSFGEYVLRKHAVMPSLPDDLNDDSNSEHNFKLGWLACWNAYTGNEA